ncbi:hypothetical protein ABN154_29865, partial [Klebsiella michiganensis]
TKNHQLTLMLSENDIAVYSGEKRYVPLAGYRDLTDRLHVTASGHFIACSSRSELKVSVTYRPSFIFARVSYHGHFREHGHYRGQKYALHPKTLDFHSAEPAI